MQTKTYTAKIKAADDAELALEHFISTEAPDRAGDVLRADGMRTLGRPVVLGFRSSTGDTEPIAKPVWIRPGTHQGQKGVLARTQFFPDDTGRRLYRKAKDGYAPNFSVGFMPLKEKPIRGGGRDIVEWDLLQYAMVAVPSDPGAVTLAKAMTFQVDPPAQDRRGCSLALLKHALLSREQ